MMHVITAAFLNKQQSLIILQLSLMVLMIIKKFKQCCYCQIPTTDKSHLTKKTISDRNQVKRLKTNWLSLDSCFPWQNDSDLNRIFKGWDKWLFCKVCVRPPALTRTAVANCQLCAPAYSAVTVAPLFHSMPFQFVVRGRGRSCYAISNGAV